MVARIITKAIEKVTLLGNTTNKAMVSMLIILMNFSGFQFLILYLLKYSDRNDSCSTVVNARIQWDV